MFDKRDVYSRFDRRYKGPASFRIRHEDEGNRGKARFWVWIIVTSTMIAVLGYLTEFMDRCRESGVFSGTVFRVSVLFFLITVVLASILRYIWGTFTRTPGTETWEKHPILSVCAVASALVCVIAFTIALIPAYEGACLAFGSCALLFVVNLGCVLFTK